MEMPFSACVGAGSTVDHFRRDAPGGDVLISHVILARVSLKILKGELDISLSCLHLTHVRAETSKQ